MVSFSPGNRKKITYWSLKVVFFNSFLQASLNRWKIPMICFNIIRLYTIISALVCDLQHKSKCAGHLAYLSPYRKAINVPDDAAPKLDSLELRADVWAAPDHRNRCSAGPPPLLNGDYCGGLKRSKCPHQVEGWPRQKAPASTSLDLSNECNVIQCTGQQSHSESRATC